MTQTPSLPTPAQAPSQEGPSGIRVVPSSSFDFLEGAFKKTANARLLNLAIISLASIIVAVLILQGVLARVDANSVASQTTELKVKTQQDKRQLTAEVGTGALSGTQLDNHLRERADMAKKAIGKPLDYVLLFSNMATLGSGINVTKINFQAPASATTATTQPQISSNSTTPPAATSATPTTTPITVQGNVADVAQATALQGYFSDKARFPYLENPVVDVNCSTGQDGRTSGSTSACQFTLHANLNEAAYSKRAEIVAQQITERPQAGG